jgi:hypothetical protein
MTTYRVAPVYAGPAVTWRVIANSEYNILSWLSEHQTETEARAEAQRLTALRRPQDNRTAFDPTTVGPLRGATGRQMGSEEANL